jgi:hypothetical protein
MESQKKNLRRNRKKTARTFSLPQQLSAFLLPDPAIETIHYVSDLQTKGCGVLMKVAALGRWKSLPIKSIGTYPFEECLRGSTMCRHIVERSTSAE